MKNYFLLSLSVLTLFSASAFAVKEGGGGDSYQCGIGLASPFSFESTSNLADLIGSQGSFMPEYFDFLSLDQTRTRLLTYIDEYRPQESQQIRAALSTLTFQKTKKSLANLNTGFKVSFWEKLLDGCKKKQLAVQDFETYLVSVYEPNYNELSTLEMGLFEIHEAYIFIEHGLTSNFQDMETIARDKVKSIFQDSDNLKRILFAHTNYGVLGTDAAKALVSGCAGAMAWSARVVDLVPSPGLYLACVDQKLKEFGYTYCPHSEPAIKSWAKGPLLYDEVVRIQDCIKAP